jgi:hypothetical protein
MEKQSDAEIRPMPLMHLVRVVNGWGDVPRTAAGESHEPYPGVERLRSDSPEFWGDFDEIDAGALIDVAGRIHPVFAAESGAQCAERLNELIIQTGIAPSLAADRWLVREVWRGSAATRLLATATLALVAHLRDEPDAGRLSTCEGPDCADVYIDRSPAARRHYCSLTCQNRNRARNYRAKQRASAPPK